MRYETLCVARAFVLQLYNYCPLDYFANSTFQQFLETADSYYGVKLHMQSRVLCHVNDTKRRDVVS